MAPGYFTDPAQYADYLKPFLTRPSYFRYANKALVSTFGGEGVSNGQWSSFKSSVGDVLVVPGFYQAQPSDSFFADKAALDGVFNWNSWPFPDAGKASASTEQDKTYQSAAKSASKLFMLGISPIQFKHIDAGQSWYRRGEDNLEERFAQALKLQPDMLELQTWNDAGESHYMGNIWDEPMTGSPIHNYVDGYDHKGYWQLLGPFVQAWKRGDATTAGMVPSGENAVQGAFWHHTLTVDADCSADPIGKAKEIAQNAEDVVSGVVLVAKGKTGLVAVVNNGEKELGKTTLVEGFNKFKFEGLSTGKVQLEIWDGSNLVVGGYAPMEVSNQAICSDGVLWTN
jgi:glucan endo-1,3-alpha-glucosidase